MEAQSNPVKQGAAIRMSYCHRALVAPAGALTPSAGKSSTSKQQIVISPPRAVRPSEPADSFCWEMRTCPWPRPSRYLRLITDLKAVHAQFHPMEKESAAL